MDFSISLDRKIPRQFNFVIFFDIPWKCLYHLPLRNSQLTTRPTASCIIIIITITIITIIIIIIIIHLIKQDRIESGECPSLFAPKCSPKRGNRLTRLCHKKEKDELPEVDLKTLGDKMEERHWFPIQDPITVDRISRIGFPLTFFAFNCIYWLIHTTE